MLSLCLTFASSGSAVKPTPTITHRRDAEHAEMRRELKLGTQKQHFSLCLFLVVA